MKKLFILALACLTGCAATGPAFKPVENVDPNNALLYIYRSNTFGLGGRAAYFYVDDVNVFDLNIEGYSWVSLPPGSYKLKQKWGIDIIVKPIEMDLKVNPGETQYMSFETYGCNAGSGKICIEWVLRRVPPETGQRDIADKRFQENFGQAKLKDRLKSQ